jgi:hypothetical protein
MKRFKVLQTYFLFILMLGVFLFTGCHSGGGGSSSGGGTPAAGTVPTVTLTVPLNNAVAVATNTKISATFSEAMDPLTITTTTFTLKQGVTDVAGAVAYVGVTATFTPTAALTANTLYTATITTGAKNLAGNGLAADYTWSFTTGAGADVTAPTVISTIPVRAATGVPINQAISATFSKAMDPATITTTTFTVTGVTGTVTYSGVTAVFTPTSNLAAGTLYTATITTGAKDLAGNALAVNYTWTFTTSATADIIKPTVISTIPANAAVGVALNQKISAVFSEAMNPLTLTTTTFTVTGPGTTSVAGTVVYTSVGKNVTFTPTINLAASTTFTATITTGAKDLAGNALAVNKVWTFTTGVAPDTTAPTVTATNPANVAVGVCINKTINATFSEPMDPLTITTDTVTLAVTAGAAVAGLVDYDSVTYIATFNPTGNLAANTNYTATIKSGASGVKDLAGNALVADKVTTFTTNASTCATAPALGGVKPFGGFGGSATLTNDGLGTVIDGDIGVQAASTKITGLTDSGGNVYTVTPNNNGSVTGLIYTLTDPPGSVAGAAVNLASTDALAAFNSISPANLPGGIDVSSLAACASCGGAGEGADALAGRTLPPGIYLSTTGVFDIGKLGRVQSILTLDAGGDANAVWVFQTAAGTGTLTVGLTGPATPATPIQVLLINGAQSKNVFWYVPAGATIGTGSTMAGTLMADAAITISTTGGGPPPNAVRTTLNGRAICITAGVTMTNTYINLPAP